MPQHWPTDDVLAMHVGRIAMAGAQLEHHLSRLLIYAEGGGPERSISFGVAMGQWLLEIGKLTGDLASRHLEVRLRVAEVMGRRNQIVHGMWIPFGGNVRVVQRLTVQTKRSHSVWDFETYPPGRLEDLWEQLLFESMEIVSLTNDTYWRRPTDRG